MTCHLNFALFPYLHHHHCQSQTIIFTWLLYLSPQALHSKLIHINFFVIPKLSAKCPPMDSVKSIFKQMQCRIWLNNKPKTTYDRCWDPVSHIHCRVSVIITTLIARFYFKTCFRLKRVYFDEMVSKCFLQWIRWPPQTMTWLLNGPYEIEQLIFIFIIICSWYAGWILDFSSQYAALHQRFAKKSFGKN